MTWSRNLSRNLLLRTLVTLAAGATLTSSLVGCSRGEGGLKATKASGGGPRADGKSIVEGAFYAPKDSDAYNVAPPAEAKAQIVFGNAINGYRTTEVVFTCVEDLMQAILFSQEPALLFDHQSQILARQNPQKVSSNPAKDRPNRFANLLCKTQPPREDSGTDLKEGEVRVRTKNPGSRYLMEESLAVAALQRAELAGFENESTADEPGADTSSTEVSKKPELPPNVKTIAMTPKSAIHTVAVFYLVEQKSALGLKLRCLEKEKMGEADKILFPADPKTDTPDFVIAAGSKLMVQTKVASEAPPMYQLITCTDPAAPATPATSPATPVTPPAAAAPGGAKAFEN